MQKRAVFIWLFRLVVNLSGYVAPKNMASSSTHPVGCHIAVIPSRIGYIEQGSTGSTMVFAESCTYHYAVST